MPKNLYEGSILKNIGLFSVPFLIANFLQTLYGLADLFIVGQFTGAVEITAVAVGSQFMHFLTAIIIGLAMGTTVLVGRAVGSRKIKSISRIVGNTTVLFLGFSLVVMAILLALCPQVVSVLSTPAEAVGDTSRYLMICFVGIPFVVAYNVIASVFRGLGDSKSPMYFIAIACILNVGLDYLLIGAFGMGASGAAYATVLAQTFSVLLALAYIRFSKSAMAGIDFSRRDFKIHKGIMAAILKIGVPVACQDGFIQVSFLFITAIANSRGLEIAAAVGVVEKIICFLFLVPSAMLSSVSAIGAQNIGAGRYDRARQTLACGVAIAACFGALCSVLFQFISEPVLSLFTDDAQVIVYGTQYLRVYVVDCMVAGIHFCFSGYFCACGYSIISFIHNALSIALMRVPGAYFASKWWPERMEPMAAATLIGSTISVFICLGAYAWLRRRNRDQLR